MENGHRVIMPDLCGVPMMVTFGSLADVRNPHRAVRSVGSDAPRGLVRVDEGAHRRRSRRHRRGEPDTVRDP